MYRRDKYFSILKELAETSDVKKFQNLITSNEYEFRFSSGVSEPTTWIPFSDKQKVVNAMCLHYSIPVSLAELEQLCHGLAIQRFDYVMGHFLNSYQLHS